MRRRLTLTRGDPAALSKALDNIGVRDGQDFTLEAEIVHTGPAMCSRCGVTVDPNRAWSQVVGFERPRAAGGTNHVADRKPTGIFLCESCMHLRKSGVPDGQESFA